MLSGHCDTGRVQGQCTYWWTDNVDRTLRHWSRAGSVYVLVDGQCWADTVTLVACRVSVRTGGQTMLGGHCDTGRVLGQCTYWWTGNVGRTLRHWSRAGSVYVLVDGQCWADTATLVACGSVYVLVDGQCWADTATLVACGSVYVWNCLHCTAVSGAAWRWLRSLDTYFS